MLLLASLLVILTGLALLASSIEALRPLVVAIWPDRIRSSFDDASLERLLEAEPPDLQALLEALKEKQFAILGLKIERTPLWGPSYREVAMVSPSLQTYASIVLHHDSSPASLYCFTPFQGRGMVFTRNFPQGREAEGDRLSVRNVTSPDVGQMVQDHVERVQSMTHRGLVPMIGHSKQARLDATRAFYSSDYARSLRPSLRWPTIGRSMILLGLFIAALVTAFLSLPNP